MKNIKAVLFDLDGTLVDSMWVWYGLMDDFAEKYNVDIPEYVYEEVSNMSIAQSSAYIPHELMLSITAEELYAEWMAIVNDAYAKKVKLKKGAGDFLRKLKENGIKLGIVTACTRELCEICLKNNKIYDLFDTITYVDEVGKGKREPDVYLECLRRLECKTEEAVLFEDILQGVRTAKLIGMKVVAVEDEDSLNDAEKIKEISDVYIQDYYEIIDKLND